MLDRGSRGSGCVKEVGDPDQCGNPGPYTSEEAQVPENVYDIRNDLYRNFVEN